MSFTDNTFLFYLLPVILSCFYLMNRVRSERKSILQNALLLFTSVIFYVWGGFYAFIITIVLCLLFWGVSFLLTRGSFHNGFFFAVGLVILCAPLLVTKYTGFFAQMAGIDLGAGQIIIPIGISFYTFQAISLFVDLYKGKISKCPSFFEYISYLIFFPTVHSGPIVRFSEFDAGFRKKAGEGCFLEGVRRFATGMIKKVLIADKLSLLSDYYFNGVEKGLTFSAIGLWISSIAYTLQIYYDFSGYSDMAIGIAEIFGFSLPENFDHPYQAKSIRQFWQKWHITLSTWFRDYIYIPLGGSREGDMKYIRNLFLVWLLTGLWHGADWSFVLWGMGYFVLLLFEKYSGLAKIVTGGKWGHVHVLFWVNLLWVPFRCSNVHVAFDYIKGMFSVLGSSLVEERALQSLPLLLIAVALCLPTEEWKKRVNRIGVCKIAGEIALLVCTAFTLCSVINTSFTPYIYGNF